MDIGVSLIITASGLVMAKYLHGPSKLKFSRLLKSSAPLFVFGIIKAIVSAKFKIGADEYGKHWNFFINLALIPFTLILADYLPSVHLVPVICLMWMIGIFRTLQICIYFIGYQCMLTYLGYSEYILKSSQDSIFEQNKIGIFSLGGKQTINLIHLYSSCFFKAIVACS